MKQANAKLKHTFLWMMAILLLAGLLGCQKPSVETNPIRQDAEHMLSVPVGAAAELPVRERVRAPASVQRTITDESGLITVRIDADVAVPDASVAPVYKVFAADFSQETVSLLFERLCSGRGMTQTADGMTKRQLEAEIATWEEAIKHISGENLQNAKQRMAYLKTLVPSAPVEQTRTPSTGQLREGALRNPYTGAVFAKNTCVDAIGEDGFWFRVQNNNDLKAPYRFADGSEYPVKRNALLSAHRQLDDTYSQFGQHAAMRIADETSVPEAAVGKLSATPAEARKTVEALLMGTDMQIAAVYLTDDENRGSYDDAVGPAVHYAYLFRAARRIGDMRLSPIDGMPANKDDYAWAHESLSILLDDSGVLSFWWESPYTVGERLTEDTQLIPFAEAMRVFERMILVDLADYTAYQTVKRSIDIPISHMELAYVRVYDSDAFDSGMLIPAWVFYGLDTARHGEGVALDGTPLAVMTINAIDGSVIDIDKGY